MTGGPDGSGGKVPSGDRSDPTESADETQRLTPRRQVQAETGSRGRLLPCGFLGQRPKPPEAALTIGAALTKPAAGHHIRRQAQVRQWQQTAPPEKPSRAIPLTWEICDFPSHGEPQAVRLGVGP